MTSESREPAPTDRTSHPEQAVARLLRFAREPGDIGVSGMSALGTLVENDDGHMRRLLDKLAESHSRGGLDSADVRVFLTVATAPRLFGDSTRTRLIADDDVRSNLVICWRSVLASQPSVLQEERTSDWIQTASLTPSPESALSILAIAAADGFGPASRLAATARRWALSQNGEASARPGSAVRRAIARRLIEEIDFRQQAAVNVRAGVAL